MKTCIVLSDTHGNTKALGDLDGIFSENDYIIHLGDTSSDGSVIRKRYPAKTTLLNGNCDLYSKFGEDECVICVEGVKIFACHGHNYSVKTTLVRLAARAKELGCDIALYGHTHEAREDLIDGVTLLNPGSLSRFGEKSYLYLVVNGDKFTYKHVGIN